MTDRDETRPRLTPIHEDPDEARRQAREDNRIAAVEPLQVRIGRHFAHDNAGQFCFDHTAGKWMCWTGLRWQIDETELTLDRMMSFTHRMRMLDPPSRRALGGVGFNKACLEVAAADRSMARRGVDFNTDPHLVGTPTGYVDLDTGIHHPPDPTRMISMVTGVSPTDEANCPKWKAFLTWACGDDDDLVIYLQKFFGYCLSGLMHEEVMTFLYGPGGNGKGVMLSTIGRVMGDYYLSTPATTFMASRHQEHATELARLQHRRLVSASETNEDDKWNMARIKEITGNENPISARFMRQDFFEFWPVCKLLIIGNNKPVIDDVDPAIGRRMRMIEFMRTPSQINRHLKDDMHGEFGGVLRWMIDGFQRYRDEGLEPPETVRRASQTYLGDQDVVQQFINDWLEFGQKHVLLNGDMGMALAIWGKANGVSKRVSGTKLAKRLVQAYGDKVEHDPEGGLRYNNKRCFRGVRIREEAWTIIAQEVRKKGGSMDDADPARGIGDFGAPVQDRADFEDFE
jgi:putative DNA primase/helicase